VAKSSFGWSPHYLATSQKFIGKKKQKKQKKQKSLIGRVKQISAYNF
jgi:hypothetical protein